LDRMENMTFPTLAEETSLLESGYTSIAGIDEVGRGSLAGPVVAAAVILRRNFDYSKLKAVKDSKLLSGKMRESLSILIQEEAAAIGVGIIDHLIIDDVNILNATKLAMAKAVELLASYPDYLLIDGLLLPG